MPRLTCIAMLFVCGVFFIAGWSVADALGIFLLPIIGGSWFFICRLLGGIVGLLLARPVMGIKTKWGYLGTTGVVLLAILVSCGAGSVGNLARLSQETVLAYRLESGDTTVAARVCIFESQYKMGLLSREETDKFCGYKTVVEESEEGETTVRYREVPKPHPLLYVWEVGKLVLLGVIAVLVFALGVMPWRKEAAQQDLKNGESGAKEKGTDKETSASEPMAKMTELRALFDAGLITEEEYEKKKAEILVEL